MASIGRFAIAAASANQDTTLALASINFDFSLVKMEAPPEYQGLGTALSKNRKYKAEEGSTHITARKLGALFADDLPHTPNLTRAYGLRVSQIAENPKYNPRGRVSDGPFTEHIGADGTSIWAAATSGRGAMAVHLLACLLARIWSSPEAISIWTEIVATRKQLLQSRLQDQQFHIGLVTACQVDLDREKLSEWDASARSWLRTADLAMEKNQKQLMLIIDNVRMPMPGKPTVYEEVINVWTKSLQLIENLVSGTAQSIRTGEALLGLSAWHIYPDLCVLGRETSLVEQKDILVENGGIATVGLLDDRNKDFDGIAWSMPLAHLRYYGRPVVSNTSLSSSSSRVQFCRIVQVAIGSLISTWPNVDVEFEKILEFLVALGDFFIASTLLSQLRMDGSWAVVISQEARNYFSAREVERDEIKRYIRLGQRRYYSFIAPRERSSPPFFGLSDPTTFADLLKPDVRVVAMRDMAELFTDESGKRSKTTPFSTIDKKEPSPDHSVSVDYLKIAIHSGYLETESFVSYMKSLKSSKELNSLIALANAHEIYQTLPEAEVDLSVASKPLYRANWAFSRLLSRTVALACVTMFDTGFFDIDTRDLDQVIAISTANNIYAMESLFNDPYDPPLDYVLRQVVGNLGRSGVSLLLSPEETIVREPELETWRSVNHVPFDGKFENNFASTSLHLSLTGYEQALNIRGHGRKDSEVSYVEAVLSAHDSGIWVADINILRFRRLHYINQHPPSASCTHTKHEKDDMLARTDLSCVDNWYEFLDPPLNSGIIRASGNWIARLALAAIAPPRDKGLTVCPDEICIVCLEQDAKGDRDKYPLHGLILC